MATKKKSGRKASLEHKGTTYRTAREAVRAKAPKGQIAEAFGITTVEVDALRIEEGLMPKTSPMAKWVLARLERDKARAAQ